MRISATNGKIFAGVVGLDFVHMVDEFVGRKTASDVRLNYEPMFLNPLPFVIDADVDVSLPDSLSSDGHRVVEDLSSPASVAPARIFPSLSKSKGMSMYRRAADVAGFYEWGFIWQKRHWVNLQEA